MASISSKKTMQGAAWRALWNTSRTPRSDSPTYIDISSGPLTEMKFTSGLGRQGLGDQRLAAARRAGQAAAPLGGLSAATRNSSAYFIGHSTASRSRCLTSSSPPRRPS